MIENIRGVKVAIRQKTKEKIAALRRGLIMAGLDLQAESQSLVPVDTGALRNSAFTREVGTANQPEVIVGYTQSYAIYVHEDLFAFHNVGYAKYLENPARYMRRDLIRTIKDELEK